MLTERLPVLALSLALAAASAQAETNPWTLGAGLTLGSDSNLFRSPAGQEVDDRYQAASLFGSLDQSLSRQQLHGGASVRRERYDERSDLNHTAYGLAADWTGSTAGDVSWKLGLNADRNLASYATVLEPGRRVANIETSRQLLAAAQLGLVAQWLASVTASHRQLDYSAAAYADDQYRLESLGATLQWRPTGPLGVSAGPRVTLGVLPQARIAADGSTQEERFRRHDVDVGIDWRASGASSLNARLSVTRQRYEILSERDFSGATGQLTWHWLPTGRTTLDFALSRDTGSETRFFTLAFLGGTVRGSGDNSSLTNRLTGRLAYQLGGKTTLSATGQYAERQIAARTTLGNAGIVVSNEEGRERSASLTLGAAWAPTRGVDLDCALTHARRASLTTLSSSYRADAANCSVRLTMH